MQQEENSIVASRIKVFFSGLCFYLDFFVQIKVWNAIINANNKYNLKQNMQIAIRPIKYITCNIKYAK